MLGSIESMEVGKSLVEGGKKVVPEAKGKWKTLNAIHETYNIIQGTYQQWK